MRKQIWKALSPTNPRFSTIQQHSRNKCGAAVKVKVKIHVGSFPFENIHVWGSSPSVIPASNSLPSKTKLKASSSPSSFITGNYDASKKENCIETALFTLKKETYLLFPTTVPVPNTGHLGYRNHGSLAIVVQIGLNLGLYGFIEFFIIFFDHGTFRDEEKRPSSCKWICELDLKNLFVFAQLPCQ